MQDLRWVLPSASRKIRSIKRWLTPLVYYIFDSCHGNKMIKMFVWLWFKMISNYDDHTLQQWRDDISGTCDMIFFWMADLALTALSAPTLYSGAYLTWNLAPACIILVLYSYSTVHTWPGPWRRQYNTRAVLLLYSACSATLLWDRSSLLWGRSSSLWGRLLVNPRCAFAQRGLL